MFTFLMAALCQLPICIEVPKPVLYAQSQSQTQETFKQWQRRQNEPNSELNRYWAVTYIETFCAPDTINLPVDQRRKLAIHKASIVTAQWNDDGFIFFADTDMIRNLPNKCN